MIFNQIAVDIEILAAGETVCWCFSNTLEKSLEWARSHYPSKEITWVEHPFDQTKRAIEVWVDDVPFAEIIWKDLEKTLSEAFRIYPEAEINWSYC